MAKKSVGKEREGGVTPTWPLVTRHGGVNIYLHNEHFLFYLVEVSGGKPSPDPDDVTDGTLSFDTVRKAKERIDQVQKAGVKAAAKLDLEVVTGAGYVTKIVNVHATQLYAILRPIPPENKHRYRSRKRDALTSIADGDLFPANIEWVEEALREYFRLAEEAEAIAVILASVEIKRIDQHGSGRNRYDRRSLDAADAAQEWHRGYMQAVKEAGKYKILSAATREGMRLLAARPKDD